MKKICAMLFGLMLFVGTCFAGNRYQLNDRIESSFYVNYDYIGSVRTQVYQNVIITVNANGLVYAIYFNEDSQTCEIRVSDYEKYTEFQTDDETEWLQKVADLYNCTDIVSDDVTIYAN